MKVAAIHKDYLAEYVAIDLFDHPREDEEQCEPGTKTGSIAELSFSGFIYDWSVEWTEHVLARFQADDDVKAVAMRINSPGGSMSSSVRLKDAIASVDNKPIGVFTSSVLGSGGYLASTHADMIAASSSMVQVGAIGAVLQYDREFEKFLSKHVEEIYSKHSPDKNELSRAMRKGDKKTVRKHVDELALRFRREVQEMRDLKGDVESTLSGGIFTADSAKRRGLIDMIGTYPEFINALKLRIGD